MAPLGAFPIAVHAAMGRAAGGSHATTKGCGTASGVAAVSAVDVIIDHLRIRRVIIRCNKLGNRRC